MPRSQKGKRGFKACDPFCDDKVRVALYNRPNGPHQGKLVLGKTYLSGLDGKCFSRTGRIKKGYRNVPIDLQREFEIEKRQIQKVRDMMQTPMTRKQRNEKRDKNAQIALQQTSSHMDDNDGGDGDGDMNQMDDKNKNESPKKPDKPPTSNGSSALQNKGIVHLQNELKKIEQSQQELKQNAPSQNINKLRRYSGESLDEFLRRVKRTTAYHLENKNRQEYETQLQRKHSALEKKLHAKQKQISLKRQQKMEHVQRLREEKKFEQRIKPKIERVPFGATNDAPPVDLRKLGAQLFGKRMHDKNVRNVHSVNVAKLSFADNIKQRALQMKKDEVLKNYTSMKRKQYTQQRKAIKLKNKKKRKVW
eukprot:CAMPEP_0202689722 /NCGR_PEP_ID=MMETSP1385-20130828/4920_1 /ASSEMBLY_ACC=CAM_ASM_000861 /TAXON_ID=933848 /ORGANISM="Elphidium margaritaceum" /LENGTH=362 /DNA_ID=CAMNT_0049344901 /DNA_START=30 /DNA_END=1115 /DNA_ORIENTATION=+